MACKKPSRLSSLVFLVLVLLMAAAGPGVALKLEPTDTIQHFPPLLDCGPATAAPNDSAFRANVLSLLAALPSAAAAAPTGSAFARSAWGAGCFLSYADTNRSTAREDAFRGWFYDDSDGDNSATAALGSQCTANRTAAECARCLNESAQVVPALKVGTQLSTVHGDAVVVVGYACYLRVPLFPPPPLWLQYILGIAAIIDVIAVVLVEVCGVLCCIRIAREFNPA